MARILSKPFGVTRSGQYVTEYILSNPGGLTVSVLDYGCIIKNIIVPSKSGPVDVGGDDLDDVPDDAAEFIAAALEEHKNQGGAAPAEG